MNKKYIQKVVKASGVKSGELILVNLWGEDTDKHIADEFMVSVAALGATPVFCQQSRILNRDIFSKATNDCYNEKYFSLISNFDAVLDIITYEPAVLGYKIAPEKFKIYRNRMSQFFHVLRQAKRYVQIRIPTKSNAQEAGMETSEYTHRMEKAYDIDYDKLADRCNHAIKQVEDFDKIILYSGADCELSFDLKGRKWQADTGENDMPCGEIYIAPNEDKTNGDVYFEQLFIDNIGEFEQVILYIRDGMVVGSDNTEVASYIKNLQRENAIVCELGLGMNPNVFNLCGYTVLDEKMEKSFHIAIGANRESIQQVFVGTGDFKMGMLLMIS